MKNKLFENEDQEKSFFLGYMVFGTFLKRWPDRLKLLQKKAEEDPVLKDDIAVAISKTEASMEAFKEAAENYKKAAKNAKEQYDNQSGVKGKIKGFFGGEQGDPKQRVFFLKPGDTIPFRFSSNPPTNSRQFSMEEILSPDFNIGLFLNPPLEGKELKEEVINNLLGFRKFYDAKSSKKISSAEIESIQDHTLDTFDPFKSFQVNESQEEAEEYTLGDTPPVDQHIIDEIKALCKPKAEEAFAKFQQSMKSTPTQVNLIKQKKILINNPYYAIHRNFANYYDNKSQLIEGFPGILLKVLYRIHEKIYGKPDIGDKKEDLRVIQADDELYNNFFESQTVKNIMGNPDTISKKKKDTEAEAEDQKEKDAATAEEKKKVVEIFIKKSKEFLKNLQRVVPVFNVTEKPDNPLETVIEINPVYGDNQSSLKGLFEPPELQIIKQLVTNQKPDFTNIDSPGILELAKKMKEAKQLRDREVFSDLTHMKAKADLVNSKAMSRNLENTLAQIAKSKRITNDNLKTYKTAIDWLNKHKQPNLFTNNPDQRKELEEQIIKLIKPYLCERIKSKRIGATK